MITLSRRQTLRLAATAAALPAMPRLAFAQDAYPSRPVHMVVGYPAGITPDIVSRVIAQGLSDRLGQPFVIDNRPGAGSNIGTMNAIRATPDGYTVLVMTFANAVNASLYRNLSFDITKDLVPIGQTFESPMVLSAPLSFPPETVPALITYAKANPDKINFASAGVGTINHVCGELFNTMAGVKLVHVPYRTNYVPDLISGQVQLCFAPIPAVIEFIRSGRLRAMAVTGNARTDALPDVPTLAEFLPGFEAIVWHGLGAPKGTPPEIVDKLNGAIKDVLAQPKIKKQLALLGGDGITGTPAQFAAYVGQEIEKWRKVIQTADIKVD
jgi:tripartite-type tricarboxylate transporter receptor subunit TctC